MTHDHREPEDLEQDLSDARLRGLFQRQASLKSDEDAVTTIWNSMRAELHRDVGNGSAAKVNTARPKKDFFSYRNVLTLTAVGLVVSVGSIFLIAVKQRSDGTVLSTVTHVERMMRRDRSQKDAHPELLPEEKRILRQLEEQTVDRIELVCTLAVEQTLQP